MHCHCVGSARQGLGKGRAEKGLGAGIPSPVLGGGGEGWTTLGAGGAVGMLPCTAQRGHSACPTEYLPSRRDGCLGWQW